MIYCHYGSDGEKARARSKAVIAALKQKRPDAEFFRVTSESWSPEAAEQFIEGQGLFERKFIVFFDGVLESTETKTWTVERLDAFKASENAFVFLERSLDAVSVKAFEKVAQEIKSFDAAKPVNRFGKGDFNTFALADALGERDKKKLWVLLSEALMNGFSPEEISGVLAWQVKSMHAAALAHNASESGLKPFVFMKSRRYADNYSREELLGLSRALLSMYHDSHRGLSDFSSALERFAFSL